MALNLQAIQHSKIFDLEKGELTEIENKRERLTAFTTYTNTEGEPVVAFTTENAPTKFYFASGTLRDFIIDNVGEFPIEKDGTHITTDYKIFATFNGKKMSKNNRMFNSWTVELED